jgi:glycosyltransferase involved in cell wall biosynthesis
MITAKLLGKKVVLAFSGSSVETLKSANDGSFKMLIPVSRFTMFLSNKIILYSPNNIQEFGLEKYQNKIEIASKHFLDFSKFKLKKTYSERDNLVGYIGRFSEEKGILNLLKAIPLVITNVDVKFLVIGDGQLRKDIVDYIHLHKLDSNVQVTGWINHDDLPNYLNELKLLVLPSYTEGLPNIMLEAMACGTPVLANAVGSISDIITNGQNGFIMTDNSPECIAKNIITILESSDIEKILDNGNTLVKNQFNFDSAFKRYVNIMEKL